ncbi:MAG: tetratricopeptide repeat protein [Verrucomicrobiia bacterium]
MKLNQLAYLFLCVFLISALHGYGQGTNATPAEKTPSPATTNDPSRSTNEAIPSWVNTEPLPATTNNHTGVTGDLHDQIFAEREKADAKKGDVAAEYNLAFSYYYGDGVPQDYTKAAKWFLKAADQDDASAQSMLGHMYECGYGVPLDYSEALNWYRKSAEQGNANGQNLLGWLYENGRGVPRDHAEAAKWFLKAANQGEAHSQCTLGWMYEYGDGVPQDYSMAVTLASRSGCSAARNQGGKPTGRTGVQAIPTH